MFVLLFAWKAGLSSSRHVGVCRRRAYCLRAVLSPVERQSNTSQLTGQLTLYYTGCV